ncbi:condensation domain-containing protein, partial [Lysobacter sp. ESA13C]|uniref:condensation domain-containing protein n=1 Tax=Lysobacter sp. ESA13C TaxID=2862676 RepID=UPI001CBB13AA
GPAIEQLQARFDPRAYRIDVSQAPLMRAFVAYDAACDKWILLLLTHHLSGDHTTLELLEAELQAHLSGSMATLPQQLPFRNFVAQARQGVSRAEHETFFRTMLGDVDEPTMPFGLNDSRGEGRSIGQVTRDLDAALSASLRTQARRLGVSVASLCHLAWGLVLARVSGRDDVVFGTVLFGRMQSGEGSDRAMGPFINTLPMRLQIDDVTVEAGVRRTHALLAELLHHEHASLALAQRCSAVAAPVPLFTALLNYRHSQASSKASRQSLWASLGMEEFLGEERTNYPFGLSIDDWGNALSFTVRVDDALDPKRIIDFAQSTLQRIVHVLEIDAGTTLNEIGVLPEPERQLVVETWNATDAPYPVDRLVHEWFEAQAAKTPDAIALVQDEASLTYAELNAQANRLAHY